MEGHQVRVMVVLASLNMGGIYVKIFYGCVGYP